MKPNKHWAINGSGLSLKSTFIEKLLKGEVLEPFVDLQGQSGVLFSSTTLNQFIKEEAIHDVYALSQNKHKSIQTFSSGEQKKALLHYLLARNPDFLILENTFDMLDADSQMLLVSKLKELSETMPIIQIFRRKDNMLPFITHVLHLKDDKVWFTGTIDDYKTQAPDDTRFSLIGNIPPPLLAFEPMSSPLIRYKNVTVNYGERHILNNVCWEINQGDFWQLMGPNGSGKTTLLSMLTGDNPKAYGQDLTLFGRKRGSGESIWDIKKKIGYVTPSMTVLFKGRHTVENMVISGFYDSIGLYQKARSAEKELAGRWIDLIGLKDLKQSKFADLTEGQQSMVLIARAMIKHPPLLILDEPTHGLDDYHVSMLTALVNKIGEESQTTIIYVSHKHEKGLIPKTTFELIPGKRGSQGRVHKT